MTPDDTEEALAHAVLAAADLEDPATGELFAALEETSPSKREGRLRVTQRQVHAVTRVGSLAGMDELLRTTEPLQELARDPSIKSGFAACQAFVQYARAAYSAVSRSSSSATAPSTG